MSGGGSREPQAVQEGAQGAGLGGTGLADGALGGLGLPDEAGMLRFEQEVLRVKLTEFVLHSLLLRSRRRPVAARGGAVLLNTWCARRRVQHMHRVAHGRVRQRAQER